MKNTKGIYRSILLTNNTFFSKTIVLLFTFFLCTTSMLKSQDIPVNSNCLICQEIQTYPQLASLNTEDGQLTQLILGQLLGTELNLTVLQWQGVTQGNVSTLELLDTLKAQFNLSSPNEVLSTEFQFSDIVGVLAKIADNSGSLALLNQMSAGIGPGTIKLSDLMTINTVNGDLVDIDFNLLNLTTGLVQLYNYNNVLVTNNPIVLDLGALGSVSFSAQVVEPPHFGCGTSGTKYFSAGIRMKLEIDLIDEVVYDVDVPILTYTASVLATIDNITLYIDVAKGEITLNTINSQTQQSMFDVIPGLARAFVGDIAIEDFFDRTKDPIDFLQSSQIGNIDVEISGLLTDDLAINMTSNGEATNGMIPILDTVPFTNVIGSSSAAVSNLMSDLWVNSEVSITSDEPITGIVLDLVNLIENDITDVSNMYIFDSNNGQIFTILENIVDPLLEASGIGIGQVIIHSDKINENCYDFGDAPETYGTTLASNGPRNLITEEIRLGVNSPSPSLNGMPSVFANQDSSDDGLVTISTSIVNGEFQVEVNYTNLSMDSAMIVGWFDFNMDGIFDNELERSFISPKSNVEPMSFGNIVLLWQNLPNDAVIFNNFLRLRISNDPLLKSLALASPNDILRGGEIEDHYTGQTSLDLDLLSFRGKTNKGENLLDWQSQSEINFHGFEIQKSINGKEFEEIGWVQGKSKNGEKVKYEFVDSYLQKKETNYYRLKMVDLDDNYYFSEIISLKNTTDPSLSKVTIYPNPVGQILYVDSDEDINGLKLLDFSGKMVKEFNFKASNKVSIPIQDVTNGMYILTVTDVNGLSKNKRLIVN